MDTEDSRVTQISGVVPRLLPSLGPVLLIALGYIDPGKWAAAVDGGARFGFDLVLLVLIFNCTAILCQYLSACVAVVTGKNLAQICNEEYNRPTCILLGVQAELSVIVLELTMILGISHGLNFLFGLDLFKCVLLTASDAILFPLMIKLLDKCRTEMLVTSVAAFTLLFYALGIFTSQPEIPFVMNEIFPGLVVESAYTLMSLLGASIMPHNFYLHSSIVQQEQQRRLPGASMGALCHEHFFAILFIFSVVFLANSSVMLSAAAVFHGASLPVTFRDTLFLVGQIFRSPVASFAFFLVLFFSSLITTITWHVGGQVLFHDFFGINPPVWVHIIAVKAIAIIPALFCACKSGAEGIYQLLIFCQVILAMLLPSSVIPLFRVASSDSIMGTFKISRFMEILVFFAFIGMLASNIKFITEVLFGDSDPISWKIGDGTTFQNILVLLFACSSFVLTLWLAATPLKSAIVRTEVHTLNSASQAELPEPSEDAHEDVLNGVQFDGDSNPLAEHAAMDKSLVSSQDLVVEDLDLPDTIVDSLHEQPQQSPAGENYTAASTSPTSQLHTEDLISAGKQVTEVEHVADISSGRLFDTSTTQKIEPNDFLEKTSVEEMDVPAAVKDDDEVDAWEPEEPLGGDSGSTLTSTYDGPGSYKSISGKSDDMGNGSGSLSRLSGLGRAARRQLAAILDEFWGKLYDFHGQVTQEAKAKRIDVILGLESKPIVSTVKTDTAGIDYSAKHFSEAERGSAFLTKSRDYDSPRQQRISSNLESSFGTQSGILSYIQSLDAYVQSSRSSNLDAAEKRYTSLRLPSYSDERDHQPATIHGYQMASYLSRLAADRNTDPPSLQLDPSTPRSTLHVPNYRNSIPYSSGQNGFGSLRTSSMQNPSLSVLSRLQAERPYYDASSVGTIGDVGSSSYPKKYHSLPDISGLVVSNRNTSLADRNVQWGNPIGPRPSVGRMSYEQSSYSVSTSKAEGLPLAFDELSPSKHYRDPFSMSLSSNSDAKSLWSRQPFEQLFGVLGKPRSGGNGAFLQEAVSNTESEAKLLQSLRFCILKLLKLDGSEWLFRENGGFDEELIERVAAREKFLCEGKGREVNRAQTGDTSHMFSDKKLCSMNEEICLSQLEVSSVPYCGQGCIWQVGLIVSFGVWCIHRVLELSLVESRPELWGKYTYVLNRLQGILDPAFFKPRMLISPCFCIQTPSTQAKRSALSPNGLSSTAGKAGRGYFTSAGMLLDLIKEVEDAVSCRKGRTGTAAGDVAFPKGKENLASVLKRYKRRLLNKSIGAQDGGSRSRKVPVPTSSFMQ